MRNKIFITLKAIYFICLLISLVVLATCSAEPPMLHNGENQRKMALLTDIIPGTFAKCWIERTVQLNTVFSDSHTPGGFPGGMSFITLNATLMDSTLIECGLKEFEDLSEMDEEEIADYVKSYHQYFNRGNYYFVWLEMQTQFTEEIFNLESWNIWCENNKGNQYDPVETIEYTIHQNPIIPSAPSSFQNLETNDNKFNRSQISTKTILLYFAKTDINGKNIIEVSNSTLSLVLLDWNDRGIRYKGTWDLKSLSNLE